MTKERVARCSYIGLILASFAVITGIVAEPVIRHVWSSRMIIGQR